MKNKEKKIILVMTLALLIFHFVNAQSVFINEGSEPSPTPEANIIQFSEPQPSEDEVECKRLGFCWYENKCYPLGYILKGKYCSDKDPYYFGKYGIYVSNFVNQSETGKACINNYECKTNICYNNVCINLTELDTSKKELNQEINNFNDTNHSSDNLPLEPKEKSIFGKIADFFKSLFR